MTSAVVIFSDLGRGGSCPIKILKSQLQDRQHKSWQVHWGKWSNETLNWLTNGWWKTEEPASKQNSENPICRKNSGMGAWGNIRGIEQKQELPEPELTKTKWILKAQQQNRAQNNQHLWPLQHITGSFRANLNTTKVIFIFSLWWREVQGRLSDQTTF